MKLTKKEESIKWKLIQKSLDIFGPELVNEWFLNETTNKAINEFSKMIANMEENKCQKTLTQ